MKKIETNDDFIKKLKEGCKKYNETEGRNNIWIPNKRPRPKKSTNITVTK